MNSLRHLFLACAAMLALTGCLQIEKIVKLQSDGSGTVEETFTMSKAAAAQMQQMMAGFGGSKDGAAKEFKLLDEARLKEAAGKMGEGVTFVSATPISSDKGEGFTAIYAFTDINALRLDQNPTNALPSGGALKASTDESKKEPVTFRFTRGRPAELAVTMPPPKAKPQKEQPPGGDDMAMQMMQQIFKDMKICLAVEVAGAITESNAEYREGSRVTLLQVDMNQLLADPDKLKTMAKAQPQSLQEAKTLMTGLGGMKIEAAPEVKVKFQ
jgi:hypothetical protein